MTPRELANSICNTLIREGHQAFLVGGCVRDLLLAANLRIMTSAPTPRPIA